MNPNSETDLFRLPRNIETRWLNPENVDGARGAGGKANYGRKGSPCRGALKAGEMWILGEGAGTGTIRRMWVTVSDWTKESLRGVVLRMYWDGAKKPAVEAPLADFFGNSHGRRFVFSSAWFNNPEGRNWNTSLPMPFRKSFRITVTNESPRDIGMFWYHIDYTLGDAHGPDTGYLHAFWSRENPTTPRRDFKILPHVKGRGRFLGCVLGLITRPYYDTWWGEGEVKIYLDGDTEWPTLCGTGTEDYICTAWATGSYSLPWYGCQFLPVSDPDRQQISMYRWHGPDPVYFKRDIRVELQQIGYWGGEATTRQLRLTGQRGALLAGSGQNFIRLEELLANSPALGLFEREDDWCATAFFYLDQPATHLPAIAPYAERIADLTGDPQPQDLQFGRLEYQVRRLPAMKDIASRVFEAHPPEAVASRRLDDLIATRKTLAALVAEIEQDAALKARCASVLKQIAAAGLLGKSYAAALEQVRTRIAKHPGHPLVLREFKAGPLLPCAADIRKVHPPKPGASKTKLPFETSTELVDIRPVHGGKDGLVCLEGCVRLEKEYSDGALAYGADGPVRVWVNGEAVDCQPTATNPAIIGQYRVPIRWKRGINRVQFAINTNQGKAWGVVVRVLRQSGAPPTGDRPASITESVDAPPPLR